MSTPPEPSLHGSHRSRARSGEARSGFWRRPTSRLGLRVIAVLMIVIVFFAYPWKADGSATYPADVPALDSVYPLNTTSVAFEPAHHAIALTGPSPGTARVDLLRTSNSFELKSDVAVERQVGPDAGDWRTVSLTAPVPSGGTYFFVYLGTWDGTSADFAKVQIVDALQPTDVLYQSNFSAAPASWHLSPYARFGVFGTPALPAIETSTLKTHVGTAVMLEPVTIPSTVHSLTVSGVLRFNGTPGMFHIVADVLDPTEHHLGYVGDWPSWTPDSVPPLPVTIRFWTIELPLWVDLVFLPSNASGGTLEVEVVNNSEVWSTQALGAYDTGRPVPLEIRWLSGQSMTVSAVLPVGPPATWSTRSARGPLPGLQDLVDFQHTTVSALVQSPAGYASAATLSNSSFTFSGAGTFSALGSSELPAVAGSLAVVASLALLSPEWLPGARAWARRLASSGVSKRVHWVWQFLLDHRLALAAGVSTLAIYGYVALTFGGHPYDSWVFKVWVYSGQTGGFRGIYIQPDFVGDAIVRGGTVPWSTTGFAYGPLSAALFDTIAHIVPPLSGYPSVVTLDGANTIGAEIKWLLALFTVAAGLVLYFAVRRSSARTDHGVVAFLLLVLNPAIAFDSVVWGETDSVLYLLFVLFAIAATYRPTWAMAVAALAVAYKETGPILLFPAALLVLAPGLALAERGRRVAVSAVALLVATLPMLWSDLLPSVLFSSYSGLFGVFVTGGGGAHPFVSPETYTVWTLWTGAAGGSGLTRMMIPSSTPLVAGLSFSVLGTAAFALCVGSMLWVTRRCGGSRSPLLWLLATSFGAVAFTALLTGTGSRYYTLAIPGLAGAVVLAWDQRSRAVRWLTVAAYALPTVLSFWTMMGLFTVIMRREYPDIRGLGLSYNPVSQFIARWYPNDAVVTLGSIGAVVLVILVSYLFLRGTLPSLVTSASPGPAVDRPRGLSPTELRAGSSAAVGAEDDREQPPS